tara:strand:+ start:226 stop:495 length:270 start_codon:yes stop_codon:yes gene_type:complete
MSENMEIVATATLTKDQVQRSVLQSVLANDENRKTLEGQDLMAHYQFNPHHAEAFCLVTLTRTEEQSQDDQEEVPSEESLSDTVVLEDD